MSSRVWAARTTILFWVWGCNDPSPFVLPCAAPSRVHVEQSEDFRDFYCISREGTRDGPHVRLDAQKNIQRSGWFLDGHVVGVWSWYGPGGTLNVVGEFSTRNPQPVLDEMRGRERKKEEVLRRFSSMWGIQHGLWRRFSSDGRIEAGRYESGKLIEGMAIENPLVPPQEPHLWRD